MSDLLYVSPSPHIKTKNSTQKIMLDVIIALVPSIIASAIIFGIRALITILITTISCVLAEYISRKILKRDNTIYDLSAVVTGILLAFNLPVSINPFIAILGSIVAIVVVKQMFGGIGQNFVNPALVARIFLMSSFPSAMSNWTKPFYYLNPVDVTTTASPLATYSASGQTPSYLDMFLGVRAGCLGETCSIALILGGIYLIFKKVINPIIPLSFIGTVFLLSLFLNQDPIFSVTAGGALLGAIFMATDYATSPLTNKGKFIFGIGCGIITVLIRVFGSLPEGVSFAIVIMNILVPHIDNLTKIKTFGEER